MSDAPQGPGWWLGQDGKYYPPAAPAQPGPYPPHYLPGPGPGLPPAKKKGLPTGVIAAIIVVPLALLFFAALLTSPSSKSQVATGPTTSAVALSSGAEKEQQVSQPAGQAPTTPPTSAKAAEAGMSQAAPAPIGTEVSPALGWGVKVESANLDATAEILAQSKYNTPSTGKQYLTVTLTISNHSDKPEMAGANIQLSLLNLNGVAIDRSYSCMMNATDELDTSAQYQPGAVVTGRLCFEVTAEQALNAVLLAEPTFTLDKAKDQRFLALK